MKESRLNHFGIVPQYNTIGAFTFDALLADIACRVTSYNVVSSCLVHDRRSHADLPR